MAVKDIIQRYETSHLSIAETSDSRHRSSSHHNAALSDPPPRPARFIRRPSSSHKQRTESITLSSFSSPYDHNESTIDITEASVLISRPSHSTANRPTSANDQTTYDELPHTNPGHLHSLNLTHQPVAATLIFARNAAPLYLPQLDKHLESIPPPPWLSGDFSGRGVFPPMDKLLKLGLSLDDLEANSAVAPAWRNRKGILGSAVNLVLGLTGSSALASFYSLQGLFNTIQIFALLLSTIGMKHKSNLGDKWRKLFLGTIPNVLALNFASTLVQSLIFLIIFMAIAAGLLFYFFRSTTQCDRYNTTEGLAPIEVNGKRWGLVIVTFLLTVIYLPLSTMAVHVLVWSQDLWIVPNPYTNATHFPPTIAPLGPQSEFRDPLDFCWTTTMKRNEINFAPVIIIISAIVILFLTIWFPVALRRVIAQSVPKIDKYSELGRPRNSLDMDSEYHRLLSRDRNPFAFLYGGFRREWGTYESTYLFAKLNTLIITAIIDPDNCLFRNSSRSFIPVIRQILLLISMVVFFVIQCLFAPFLDPVNNASEWTSRLNYVTTAAVALAVALSVPGKNILNTYVLYAIYIITYGLSFYFTIINLGIMQRVVKRLTRRFDFSIDIFSPHLDISPTSPHTKRRIWQESISTLLLTNTDCKIPTKQVMNFAQARDSEFPPYLTDFCGTPGERHVENLKILREVGSLSYRRAIALISGPDYVWHQELQHIIQEHFTGPDCYWKNPRIDSVPGCTSFFGNAWWIPFPPTLVIRYDEGPTAVLQEATDFQTYINQNALRDIQQRRQIRLSLRALEGQRVFWPYQHKTAIGASAFRCCGSRYKVNTSKEYATSILRIKRNGHLVWRDSQLGSGFKVELHYSKNVVVTGDIIGLNDDYDLNYQLARFLEFNRELVAQRLEHIEKAISTYRHHHKRECAWKNKVLTYRFLTNVYDQPRDPDGLAESSIEFERDIRVRQLMVGSEAVFRAAYERLAVISGSEAATWWYLFWDDLWRRNHDTIAGLELHASDFDPQYRTSIAYTPLPRPALEAFLRQRGLLSVTPRWADFFHSGFLNKIYLRLNEAAFRASARAIMFHVGSDSAELDMDDIDVATRGQSSTLGTGGGTDHDDSRIRTRPTYRWEGLLNDPWKGGKHRPHWLAKLGAWFGLTPLWRSGTPSNGLAVDVRLEGGRYIIMQESIRRQHVGVP
ncbi:hypothetical protein BD779DRAFT_1430682 [Infundibulicybe gibba]|nr:hypothetical protein BD779DRAFT_1430682 [Infundibulicybe gibba]